MSDHFFLHQHGPCFWPYRTYCLCHICPGKLFCFGADSGGKWTKQDFVSGLHLRNQHIHLAIRKVFFPSFLHIHSLNGSTTTGLFILISIFNVGYLREETRRRVGLVHVRWISHVQRECAWKPAYARIDTSDFFCAYASFQIFRVRTDSVGNPRKC